MFQVFPVCFPEASIMLMRKGHEDIKLQNKRIPKFYAETYCNSKVIG